MGKGFYRIALPILGVVIAAGALTYLAVRSYNALQVADEQVGASWAHVVNQYQRRADLVPNLVRVVQAYAVHERELFREVAQARSAALDIKPDAALLADPKRFGDYQAAQNTMQQALGKLLLVAERYPELRANESFRDLQVQLEGTENRISHARDKYIYAISVYNMLVRGFPSNLMASQLDYAARPNLTLDAGSTAETAPEIAFQ